MLRERILPFVLVGFLAACGGGSGGSTGSRSTDNNTPGQSSPVGQFVTVNVTGGQTRSGVDVNVPAPAGNPAPNAQLIGVADPNAGVVNLSNVSARLPRGTTRIVMVLGPGLSGTMTPQISGPQDITISNIRNVPVENSNPPGIQFTVTVSSSAAVGARSVRLFNSANDMTAFAGGLEVQP